VMMAYSKVTDYGRRCRGRGRSRLPTEHMGLDPRTD